MESSVQRSSLGGRSGVNGVALHVESFPSYVWMGLTVIE
jgi:hypothetical protein